MAGLAQSLEKAGTVVAGAVVGGATIAESAQTRAPSAYDNVQTTVFPSDLIDATASRAYFMSFTFYQYQRPSIFQQPFTNPLGTIILPLPAQLIDAQSENYNEDYRLNPAVGAALDAAARSNDNALSGIENLINEAENALSAIGVGSVQNLANKIGQVFGINNGAAALLQTQGLAINPYLTVLFTSPAFKRHTFSWKLTATNITESQTLKYILNKLRYHQLPDTNMSSGGSLLKYPDLVFPSITPAGFVYSFKYCVIESAEVNYAPGETPGFYSTSNAPVTVGLTLRLLEIEYWLKKDINNNTVDPNYTFPSTSSITTYTNLNNINTNAT